MFDNLNNNTNSFHRISVLGALLCGMSLLLFVIVLVVCWMNNRQDDFGGYVPPTDLQIVLFWSAAAGSVISVAVVFRSVKQGRPRRRDRTRNSDRPAKGTE